MARRGRKPKPTRLKLLEGARPDRINGQEPPMPAGLPRPPEVLDPGARAEWDRLVELLADTRVLARTDGAALALYCQTYSRWAEAERCIREHGMLVEAANGGVKLSPYVVVSRQAVETMSRLLVEFGLTPSSRARLKVAAERPKDELELFLAGGA